MRGAPRVLFFLLLGFLLYETGQSERRAERKSYQDMLQAYLFINSLFRAARDRLFGLI